MSVGSAQVVVPPQSKKHTIRPIGSGTTGGAILTPGGKRPPQKIRYTVHLILSELRQWTSADGKTMHAKLIAFEDLVAETPKGVDEPTVSDPPAHPTVVRDGKVRLVFNNSKKKPFLLPLNRLSQPDREFIEKTRLAHAKKPTPPSP